MEDQIPRADRICEPFRSNAAVRQEQCGDHKYDTISEYQPRGLDGVISKTADFSCQYRVTGPHDCGCCGQQVTDGV